MPSDEKVLSVDKRYILTDKIGTGGMGVVFLADDRLTGNQVALKQVLTNTSDLLFATKSFEKDPHRTNMTIKGCCVAACISSHKIQL